MDIIVSRGFGSFEAWEATVANAKEILSWQTIPAEVKKFAENRPAHYATYETVAAIIQKLLKAEDGEVVFKSRKDGSEIVATTEAKQQTVLYLFEKKVSPDKFSSYDLKDKCNVKDLPWLSRFHDVVLTERWLAEWAEKYYVIQNGVWKEGVADSRKIRYILEFVNELCHRDGEYEIVSVKATA